MFKKTGFIEGVSRDGKRFKMGEDWFSAYAASQMAGINKGDYVEFSYMEKPSPTGDVYRNVKGNVSKATPPASEPMTAAGVMSVGKGGSNPGFIAKAFPVPPFHPDRSIIRQNSLSHAVNVCNSTLETFGTAGVSPEEFADKVIEIARMFEAYSAGDLDVAIVEEEMRALVAREHGA